ncbi:uncharacterized protein LOC126373387 [Pectinophora gossypiella]|uniref:uncharacterized protein LOC126373387 n=1 Tax=Pectinophora gossypiella TaxID=13191 RepID=UPI00214E1891|nr:uncharacterized protein LOC126373387 [Pectinophora gossypiella]
MNTAMERVKMLHPSLETGTLLFAIINLLLVIISTAHSIGCLGVWAGTYLLSDHPMSHQEILSAIQEAAVIIIWMILSIIGLIFSSFLLNGIIKKKPQDIKAYYVFGVASLTVAVLVLVGVFICSGVYDLDLYNSAVIMFVLVLYSLALCMIRSTYIKLEAANDQFSHKPLDEKC